MATYLLTAHHIDAILTGALALGIEWGDPEGRMHKLPGGDVTRAGRILRGTNQASVNARYGEDDDTPDYAYRMMPGEVNLTALVKAVQALSSNSASTPGWPDSEAKRILDAIRDKALARLGLTLRAVQSSEAYDAAPYEISDRTVYGGTE